VSKQVRELMHPGLITCRPDTSLGEVASLLTIQHVHALLVADRDGRILGLISDFDLLAAEWLSADQASLEAMRRMTAGELMTTPVASIDAGAPASNAAKRMTDEGISRLLVTEGQKPVGVLSVSDLIAHMASMRRPARDTVADVMSRTMLVCRDATPVADIARGMTDSGYRSAIVVDAIGKPLGVISGLDLLAYCKAEGCGGATAAEVMHPALTIAPGATLREAADKLIEHHHHRLVVVDPEMADSMPLGVISTFDIVAAMAHPGSVWRR
jgi:CBS domain-containing protein